MTVRKTYFNCGRTRRFCRQSRAAERPPGERLTGWLTKGKLLEDGFPLKFWLGWKRSWLLRQAEEAVFPLKAG